MAPIEEVKPRELRETKQSAEASKHEQALAVEAELKAIHAELLFIKDVVCGLLCPDFHAPNLGAVLYNHPGYAVMMGEKLREHIAKRESDLEVAQTQ